MPNTKIYKMFYHITKTNYCVTIKVIKIYDKFFIILHITHYIRQQKVNPTNIITMYKLNKTAKV